MHLRGCLLGTVASLVTMPAFSTYAQAQDAAGDPNPQIAQSVAASANSAPTGAQVEASGQGLKDIIVTARRRSESAQTVPVAVSVASAESLEQHQVLNAYQLVNLTPSLQTRSTN